MLTATMVVKGDKIATPTLVLTMNNATSTAPSTVLNVACPAIGTAFVWFAPAGTAAPTDS